jgi:hypothetical protein
MMKELSFVYQGRWFRRSPIYVNKETEIDSFNTFLFTYKVEINVVENLLIH